MNYRVLILVTLLMTILTADSSVQAQKKPDAVAKTTWGDPDLQGTWTSDDCINTPLQRQANLGDKLYLTDEELTQREAAIARQSENDKQQFVAANAQANVNPPGHWGERARRPCRQTSLIIDPPNGRTPDLTPEAQARAIPRGAGNNPASWEDFSFYIRCITRGVAGSILPVIYGNGTQILQGPGYVLLLQEM